MSITVIEIPMGEYENYHSVVQARVHQDQKWGEQDHTEPEWISILAEEFGEASMAANKLYWAGINEDLFDHDRYEKTMYELSHTAAVCLVMMKNLRARYEQ